jgi:tetratricopeptide (TPR) repeat protein
LSLVDAVQRGATLDALPTSVESIVAEQVDRLDVEPRRLLRLASVLGTRFSTSLLRDVAGPYVRDVETGTRRLDAFLESAPGGLRFRSELVRQVAYEGLPFSRRRELHARAGDLLAASDVDDAHIELLSLHFHAARRFADSWRTSRAAGDQARDRYANVEAATFYRRALDAARAEGLHGRDVAAVAESLGDVHELLGEYDEAIRAYASARAEIPADDGDAHARLLRKTGRVQERRGQYRAALSWHQRALKAAKPESPEVAKAMMELASVRYWQERFPDCIAWCERAIDVAQEVGDKHVLAHAYHLLHLTYTDLNDVARIELRDAALPIYEALDDLLGQGNVLTNVGIDHARDGDWVGALELWHRGRAAFEQAGDVVGAAGMAHNIGEALSNLGRLDEAEGYQRDALRIWTAARFVMGATAATSGLGRTLARGGHDEEALLLLAEALVRFEQLGRNLDVVETKARVAEAHAFAGRWSDVRATVDDALADAQGAEYAEARAQLFRFLGNECAQRGDSDGALDAFARSLAEAQAVDLRFEIAETLAARAAVGGPTADIDRRRALDIFAELGATPPWIDLG